MYRLQYSERRVLSCHPPPYEIVKTEEFMQCFASRYVLDDESVHVTEPRVAKKP